MRQFPALQKGDTVGLAAPASPFDKEKFQRGLSVLEELGFKIYFRQDIFEQTRYFAGSDQRRAEELQELFLKEEVKAILFARGGYGSQRIIKLLNAELIKNNGKPVVGFSDTTSLLAFLRQECALPTFYGPVVTQLGQDADPATKSWLWKTLTSSSPLGNLPSNNSLVLRAGKAKGVLVGGCLSLINSSLGTPYELKTAGSILFIEDGNEKIYVLDRMLTQLKNARKLDQVQGVIFGTLVKENEKEEVRAMVEDVLRNFKGPILMNYPAGHTNNFITLPLGVEMELTAVTGQAPNLNCKTTLLCTK